MSGWWDSLSSFNQWMYGAAVFFGVIFLYEIFASFIGLGGHADVDSSPDHDFSHDTHDASQSAAVFKLFSVRSIIAFFTLFTWAVALYLNDGKSTGTALGLGVIWGVAAMIIVTLLMSAMRRMAYTGTANPASCIGSTGTVHLDIPAGGEGEIRLLCGGAMTHFRARMAGGGSVKAGALVTVKSILGANTVEVELNTAAQKATP